MRIYQKYIIKNIIPSFVLLTVLITSLALIARTLNMVHLIDKGIELKHFFELIILLVPSLLFTILPIISIITVIYVYHRLQDERQIMILKSSGINNYDLIKPSLLFASIVTIFALSVSVYFMPLSYNIMKDKLSYFGRGYVSSIINSKTFNQLSKNLIIYVDKKEAESIFKGVILFDGRANNNKTIIFAKTSRINYSAPYQIEFELTDGVRHSYDKRGNLTKLYFDNLNMNTKNNIDTPDHRKKTSMELYINEMLWPNSKLTIEKQKQFIVDGHFRIMWPLYNFVLVFLSLSIFLNQPYNRKTNKKQFIVSFVPILLITYFHFSLQKFAYKNLVYIAIAYINIICCIMFSIRNSLKKIVVNKNFIV